VREKALTDFTAERIADETLTLYAEVRFVGWAQR
jgi:hypothetical protein